MYFRSQQKSNLLIIDDVSYALLKNIDTNGNLTFEFTYSISSADVVSQNAQKVVVSVASRTLAKKSLLGTTQRGSIDTQALVNNIRTSVIDAKTAVKQLEKYTLASQTSDVTAFMNNEAVPNLVRGAKASNIQAFSMPTLTLASANSVKQTNNPQPVLHVVGLSGVIADVSTAISASTIIDKKSLMTDMVYRQGIDPSVIVDMTPRTSSENRTHGGMLVPRLTDEKATDPASKLLNSYLFPVGTTAPPKTTDDVSDTQLVQVLSTVTSDVVTVPVTLQISASDLKLGSANVSQLYVTFDLLDTSTQQPVDSVVKVLNLIKHLQVYRTPRQPPIIKVVASEAASTANLEIRQRDARATSVRVYKKLIWVSSPDIDDYTLIGTFPLTIRDQPLRIQVDVPLLSLAAYRVIAFGPQGVQGFEFTNVILKPSRYVPSRSVSLVAKQVDAGIQLEARKIPSSVISIQFLRYNLTTFDASPTIVNSSVFLVDGATRKTNFISTIDAQTFVGNIYRYVARLLYVDGSVQDYGDATLEYLIPPAGQVDTTIDNFVVSHVAGPNVSFSITTTIIDTTLDVVKELLLQQNVQQFFQGDLQQQRDELKNLIAHNVQRVDLNTGQRVDFGVLTNPAFDDVLLRKNQSIEPLMYGHRYRYEVFPLLRAPETLFSGFQKTSVDDVTKKTYVFSPAKFLHPLALIDGTLVTENGAKSRYAKDPMSFGALGSTATVEASFNNVTGQLTNPLASQFDRTLYVVSWLVQGDISSIDHFLIMKQVHGMKTMVGKVHSEFTNGSCQFMHSVSSDDVGALSYVIVPVFGDYSVGDAVTTNVVTVEAL